MADTTDPLAPIDPALVPQRTLRSGRLMPAIGFGTFGSDSVTSDVVAQAVSGAIRTGYRLIDCAACYGNEQLIGEVLSEAIPSVVSRSDLFVVSKVWNDAHSPEDVARSARQSLKDLQLDYLDAYLVHWPFPNYHAPFAKPEDRNPASRPYIHEEYMETWAAMEKLVDEGLVREIGTSNMTIPKLRLVLRDARIAPALNEMELHPCFQQGELFQFCVDHEIQPVGFSPLGSPGRPERDRSDGDYSDIEMPEIKEIAETRGVHPAEICLKWAVQRGQIPIPFSTKPRSYTANMRTITEDPLTPAELETLRGVERNSRLIKGQVFLWPGADSYLDLWDVDGTIPSWNGYTE